MVNIVYHKNVLVFYWYLFVMVVNLGSPMLGANIFFTWLFDCFGFNSINYYLRVDKLG